MSFRVLILLLLGFALSLTVVASNVLEKPADDPSKIFIPAGTEISMTLFEDVSSALLVKGNIIKLNVYKELRIDGKTIVNTGRYGEGRVVESQKAGVFGRPGKIVLEAINVETVTNERIPLIGETFVRIGKERRLLAWALTVGLALGAFLAGSLIGRPKNGAEPEKSKVWVGAGVGIVLLSTGFFVPGKNVEVKAAEEIIMKGYVSRDIWLDTAKQ